MSRILHESEANSQQPVELQIGEDAQIVLAENPTTGFRWVAEPEPTESRFQPADSTAVGAAGHRILTFRGLPLGEHLLRFKLRRAWEENVVKEVHFRIQVR